MHISISLRNRRRLTATFLRLRTTSSFFWLGLLGSVIFGFILTISRSRHARLVASTTLARSPSLPVVVPKLWDAYILAGQGEEAGEKAPWGQWDTLIPLSLSVSGPLESKTQAEPPSSRTTHMFTGFRRHPTATAQMKAAERAPAPAAETAAQLSTVILLPHQAPRSHGLFQAYAAENGAPDCEYAIGTTLVSYSP
ncbi:hypothetical protein BDW22DRAFT_695338 [Trametopsis cervina]|nr:hypothetical protein BDW22DRAFT_695338 [Trametopsis cervina]